MVLDQTDQYYVPIRTQFFLCLLFCTICPATYDCRVIIILFTVVCIVTSKPYHHYSTLASVTQTVPFAFGISNESNSCYSGVNTNKTNQESSTQLSTKSLTLNSSAAKPIHLEPKSTTFGKTNFATKRTGYLSWEEYFMAVALLSTQRSKDPATQVGACIVNPHNVIVSVGYNGFPIGCSDDVFPWTKLEKNQRNTRDDSILQTKDLFVCHAELNAILNKSSSSLRGCTLYVSLFPCDVCTKLIIQSRIQEVVYLSDKNHESTSVKASKMMLDAATIKVRRFETKKRPLLISWELSQNPCLPIVTQPPPSPSPSHSPLSLSDSAAEDAIWAELLDSKTHSESPGSIQCSGAFFTTMSEKLYSMSITHTVCGDWAVYVHGHKRVPKCLCFIVSPSDMKIATKVFEDLSLKREFVKGYAWENADVFSHPDFPGRYFGLLSANFGVRVKDLKFTMMGGVPVPLLEDLFVLELALYTKDYHFQHTADVVALCILHKSNLPSTFSLPEHLQPQYLKCLRSASTSQNSF